MARVTVIDTNLQSVYEAVVRPEYEVIDYNTRLALELIWEWYLKMVVTLFLANK